MSSDRGARGSDERAEWEQRFREEAGRVGLVLDALRIASLLEQADALEAAVRRLRAMELGDIGPAGGPLRGNIDG